MIRLKRLEVLQLVQAQQTQLPQVAVVNLTFLQRQFTANDLVTGRGVALKFNAPNEELLAFIEIDLQRDLVRLVVGVGVGHGSEIDVPERGVRLAQVLQTFANGLGVEDVAVFDLELRAQRTRVGNRLVAAEGDLLQLVAIAFLYWHFDVDGLPGLFRKWPVPWRFGVVNLCLWVTDERFEVTLGLIEVAHPLGVFVQLG